MAWCLSMFSFELDKLPVLSFIQDYFHMGSHTTQCLARSPFLDESREAASHGGVCGALIRTVVPCSIMPLFSGYICELLRNSCPKLGPKFVASEHVIRSKLGS